MRPSVLGCALAALLMICVLPSPAQSAGSALVRYDQKKDTLTIEAADVAIEDILTEISIRTGMRILIDPEVQKNVTISLKDVPLESALHQLARGLSYALFYESGTRKQRVVGMRLVPKGQAGSAPLRELGRAADRQPSEALSYTGDRDGDASDDGSVLRKTNRPQRRGFKTDRGRDASGRPIGSPADAGIVDNSATVADPSGRAAGGGGHDPSNVATAADGETADADVTDDAGGAPDDEPDDATNIPASPGGRSIP